MANLNFSPSAQLSCLYTWWDMIKKIQADHFYILPQDEKLQSIPITDK